MPDPADDRAAFREAMRRAEEAAVSGETSQELTSSAVLEPPDPVAEAAPVGVEGEQTEPVEPTETPVEEIDPVARVAELEAAIAEREARIEEQGRMIGRQSTEVGEVRQEIETLRQQFMQPAAQPVMPITQHLIDENPAQATVLAYQQNNAQALEVAFQAWSEEDPGQAQSWRTERLLEAQQRDFQQEMEKMRAEVQTFAQPAQEAAREADQRRALQGAFDIVSAQIPGFSGDEAARLIQDVGPQFPAVISMISEGDAETRAQGLTLLYGYDKARTQDPAAVAAQAAEEARAAATAAANARASATVVSQDTAGLGGSEPELTPEEQEIARYKLRLSTRPSVDRGWTGRAAR